jgi:isochorismate synthase
VLSDYDDEDGIESARSELTSWLARHLVAERGASRLVVLTLPAPIAPLETFLGVTEREYGVVWHPPDGPAWAASGATEVIPLPGGKEGLQALRDGARRIFEAGVHYLHPGAEAHVPRLFGGIAFADAGNDVAPWTEFSDGCFSLPRWTYARTTESATLSLAVRLGGGDPLMVEDAILAEYETISDALGGHDQLSTQATHFREVVQISRDQITQVTREAWKVYVDTIRRGIQSGQFSHLVAARSCVVDLPEMVEDTTVLARLGADFPETTRFAFRRAKATLLGASPETLFSKKGSHLDTEVLAGTIRSLGSDFPRASRQAMSLLNNKKELGEHESVLKYMLQQLEPLTQKIDVPADAPHVRKIRNIIHLNTPIKAALCDDVDALALLSLLHPTPAVGGIPRSAAVDFIRCHEEGARGWYTGAVGWIDAQGDACFNVVIRAGVLEGGRRVHIYTGASIGADSDADAEYAETELKQQPMFRALGII